MRWGMGRLGFGLGLLSAVLAAVGCGTVVDREELPGGWVEFDTGCGVRFYAPPETVAMTAQGIDSCIAGYATGECALSADVGQYADPLDSLDLPELRVGTTRADGRSARLVSYAQPDSVWSWVTALHLPGDDDTPGVTFSAACHTRDALQLPQRIFRTIALDPR